MPIDREKKIFGSSDDEFKRWDQVRGEFLVREEFIRRRGVNAGISVLAQAGVRIDDALKLWNGLDFFLNARLETSLKVQFQTPLNLFEEIGLAARVQAIARAAVGVGIESDITVGQILDRVTRKPEMDGLPGQILNILMDEVEIEGVMFAQLAIAVMGYANMVISADIFGSNSFEIVFETGYGFKAGGGYRWYVRLDVDSPRRILQRLMDVFIFEILRQVKRELSTDQILQLEFLFRIVFRLSLDLGNKLEPSKRAITRTFIEEGQWWFYRSISHFVGDEIRNVLRRNNIRSDRALELLDHLMTIPTEANDLEDYIEELVSDINQITSRIPSRDSVIWLRSISTLWASLTILKEMSRLFVNGSSDLFIFNSSVVVDPRSRDISSWINQQLARPIDSELTLHDLRNFLIGVPLTVFLEEKPSIANFIELFKPYFMGTEFDIIKGLLNHPPIRNPADPLILRTLLSNLQILTERALGDSVRNSIKRVFGDRKEIRLLVDSTLLPLVDIVMNHVLPSLIDQPNDDAELDEILVEAISSALLPLVGRPVVFLSEEIHAAVQQQIPRKLNDIANRIESLNLDFFDNFGFDTREMKFMIRPLQVALRTVAQNANQFPSPNRIFTHLKEIFTPISPNRQVESYMNELEKPEWMPRQTAVENLVKSFAEFMLFRMAKFSAIMIVELIKAHILYLLDLINLFLERIQVIIDQMVNALIQATENFIIQPLERLFFEPALGILRGIVRPELLEPFRNVLGESIRNALGVGILPRVKQVMTTWKLDPNNFLDAIERQDVSLFTDVTLNSLRQHLTRELRGSLGISVRLKTRFLGQEISVDLENISLPANQIIPVITEAFTNFSFRNFLERIDKDYVRFIKGFREKIEELTIGRIDLIRRYTFDGRVNRSLISTKQDPILLVRLSATDPKVVEVIIHLPDRNMDLYRRFSYDSVVYIFLNQIPVPLHTFFHKGNMSILNRSSGMLLQRSFRDDELEDLNTFVVVTKGETGQERNAIFTFSK